MYEVYKTMLYNQIMVEITIFIITSALPWDDSRPGVDSTSGVMISTIILMRSQYL